MFDKLGRMEGCKQMDNNYKWYLLKNYMRIISDVIDSLFEKLEIYIIKF
jgi:hypothetical protein